MVYGIISNLDNVNTLEVLFQNDMNLFVSGQLGGSYEDNMLKFKFRADQTLLSGLKEVLINY